MGITAAIFAGVGAAGGVIGGISNANSLRDQGDVQLLQATLNSAFSDLQAEDALASSDDLVRRYQEQLDQSIGTQRAAAGASGIEIDSGSALDAQNNNFTIGQKDILTLKNNAWREAWGHKVQSEQEIFGAEIERAGLNDQADKGIFTSILGGASDGAKIASSFAGG